MRTRQKWIVYKERRSDLWCAWKYDYSIFGLISVGRQFLTHKAALAYAISHAYPTTKDKQ